MFKFTKLACSALGFFVIFAAIPAFAIPAAEDFKRFRDNASELVLKQCSLTENIQRLIIGNGGRRVEINSKQARLPFKLDKAYDFFACEDNIDGGSTLFAKTRRNGEATVFNLTLDDFPIDTTPGGFGCDKLRSWPGGIIYKTVGSKHFTDVRRNTIGIIAKPGSGIGVGGCLTVHAKNGKEIAKLGLYARGAGWDWRAYAGVGCGAGTAFNGNKIASLAQNAAGSEQVAVKIGNTCFGPINPRVCIGSVAC